MRALPWPGATRYTTAPVTASIAPDLTAARLKATHLFSELDPPALARLAASCQLVELAAGEVLLREGEAGDELYVVISGALRVTRREGEGALVVGELRPGEHVGELALLEKSPRTATVTSLQACTLLSLSRRVLEPLFESQPQVREMLAASLAERRRWSAAQHFRPPSEAIVSALARFLEGVERATLQALEREVQWVALPRGAVLLKQGEAGDCLYFVESGRLRIHARGEDGEEVTIAEVGPGESVGEMALLGGQPRSASASAAIDCELLRLSKAGFERLLRDQPRAMAVFTRVLLDRLAARTHARAAITQLRSAPLATAAECDEIARTEHLVLRNLKITQMYHRLSQELALLVGHEDANWCTFACNASKTAGYSIRHEELPFAEVLALARRRPWVRAASARAEAWVQRLPAAGRARATLDAVSAIISAGNLKVFAEVAPVFVRLVQAFHKDVVYDRGRLEAFQATLRPGPTEVGGQQLLREAAGHYYEAAFERRVKVRSELILLGNVRVGLHEQSRLQPHIVDALNTPLAVGLGGLLAGRAKPALPLGGVAQRGLGVLERRLAQSLTGAWRRLVTRSMMTLRLPYGEVRLGSDVPRLPDHQMFPDVLREITHPELRGLVRRFDRDPETLAGSRAADWGNLDDRMNFILNLFRSRQRSLELFGQPFDLDQRASMEANQVPLGRL